MKKRDTSVDVVRGIAVILMIASHTTWLLSNDQQPFWHSVRLLGDSLALILFLFLFGYATFFSYFSKTYDKSAIVKKWLHHMTRLLVAYYIIAFVTVLFEKSTDSVIQQVAEVLLFIRVPGFTEFLVTFMLYKVGVLLLLLIHKKTPKITFKNILIVSILLYGVGAVISSFTMKGFFHSYIESFLSLFVLYDGYIRFPVLLYAPVFLFGLWYGSSQGDIEKHTDKKQYSILKKLGGGIGLFCILLVIISNFYSHPYLTTYNRWPTSLLFIAIGLFAGVVLLYSAKKLQLGATEKAIAFLGIYSLEVVVFHVVFMRLYTFFLPKTDNFLLLLILFIISLLGGPILASLYKYLKYGYAKHKQ